MRNRRGLVQFFGLVLLVSGLLRLQAQFNRGLIEGVVADPQGAVIPAVTVTVISHSLESLAGWTLN